MCSESQKKPEVLMKLLELGWTNFDHRRIYQWKMTLAIWTAIAAFIALYLKGDAPVLSAGNRVYLLVGALLVILVQTLFLIGMRLANGVDQKKALFYEALLNDISVPPDDARYAAVEQAIKRIKWTKGLWSIPCEVAITAILLLCCYVVVFRG